MKLEKWVRWLRVSMVILVTTTILTVWMTYASAQIAHKELDPGLDSDPLYRKVIVYDVEEISKPITYWVLEEGEADPYIQEALRDPGHYSHCFANETTFLQQVYDHDAVWEIEFEGCYYSVGAFYRYDGPGLMPKYYVIHLTLSKQLEKAAVVSGVMLLFAWVAVGVVWFKKVKQNRS